MSDVSAINWTAKEVEQYLAKKDVDLKILNAMRSERVDGKSLLLLNERDLNNLEVKYGFLLGDIKRFSIIVNKFQLENRQCFIFLGIPPHFNNNVDQHSLLSNLINGSYQNSSQIHHHPNYGSGSIDSHFGADLERISPATSVDGGRFASSIQPELFKTALSMGYAFLVTWITAFVMVVVHERVPDMKRYPPLPDIFLDNVPHIPWAFFGCEITGTFLFIIWLCVLILHKYRLVLLRRFFALAGTVFLLRCFTMLITSLSVPGTHLDCRPSDHKFGEDGTYFDMLSERISRAYTIWSGLGMSIQGVRTCGDYMFSGHTVALTTLNFFITEYTPRNLYFLHTITWILNMFGVFFILSAHEHYSIDVFVAFYITSRLFLYYHTLANNQALMSHDSNRTRIWFPMFSYFESSVDGIIPNEYNSISEILIQIGNWIISIKDICMLTARRFWIAQQNLTPARRPRRSQSLSKKNVNKLTVDSPTNLNFRHSSGNISASGTKDFVEPLFVKEPTNCGPKKDD
ncbi:unnamed protein product [Diamesa hyperborea]